MEFISLLYTGFLNLPFISTFYALGGGLLAFALVAGILLCAVCAHYNAWGLVLFFSLIGYGITTFTVTPPETTADILALLPHLLLALATYAAIGTLWMLLYGVIGYTWLYKQRTLKTLAQIPYTDDNHRKSIALYHQKHLEKNTNPEHNKGRLLATLIFWPFSLLGLFLAKPLVKAATTFYRLFNSLIRAIWRLFGKSLIALWKRVIGTAEA